MALTKQIETSQGFVLENAYIKIHEQSGNMGIISIRVVTYKDKVAREEGKDFLEEKLYAFVPNLEENFIKQGYEYLKTLNEYNNAIDC